MGLVMESSIFPPRVAAAGEDARGEARRQRAQRRRARRESQAGAAHERRGDAPVLARGAVLRAWELDQNYFYRLCLGWTDGNVSDAEDVMGQAWVKILELELELEAARSIRNPRSWISRVLRNLCIDRGRAYKRTQTLVREELAVPTPGPTPAPDADLVREQLAAALASALGRLPDSLREVVVLRLIRECSYEEIGRLLDISVPNARKRLQQARALMRPDLAEFWVARSRGCGPH